MGYESFGYICWVKSMVRFFDFYLNASVHVALAVFSFVRITGIQFNFYVDVHLGLALFFATIATYNFVKYGIEAEKYVVMASGYLKLIQAVSLLAFVLALYHLYFLRLSIWIALAILTLLSALYTFPVLPRAKNMRSWGGAKIFVVATVWTGATVGVPLLGANIKPGWDHGLVGMQRFLLVVVLMLPFEIRDLKFDPVELRTIPQRFGVLKTKSFGMAIIAIMFLMTFLKDNITAIEIFGNLVLSVVLVALLGATSRNQSKYFSSFWVESVPLLWWGLLILIECCF